MVSTGVSSQGRPPIGDTNSTGYDLIWNYVNDTHINMCVSRKYDIGVPNKFVLDIVRDIFEVLKFYRTLKLT